MPKIFLTSLVAAMLFPAVLLALPSPAPTVASPAPGFAGGALVREAAIVCGGNGCNAVPTKAQKRRKFHPLGYTKPI